MRRLVTVVRKSDVKQECVMDRIILDHNGRHKRRIAVTSEKGNTFLLDLEKATILLDGDALQLEDGNMVLVNAAPESLLEIRADNPLRLLKIAWHIGNRHTPAEITQDAIYIQDDHVLAEMVRGQGCVIDYVSRPFQPESGAYSHNEHGHGHVHSHGHGHSHSHH